MINLQPRYLEMVKKILQKNLTTDVKVFVFGSRATEKVKKFSDLDLALFSAQKIPFSVFVKLSNDFEESDLPYKVDIIDLKAIDKNFRDKISKDLKELNFVENS